MPQWEIMQDAVKRAHDRGQEWLTVGEIVNGMQALDPSGTYAGQQATVRAYCINDPSKKHFPGFVYRRNPILITDDPTMRGKRYRLLTDNERQTFLSHPRDDCEKVSYSQLVEWLSAPETTLEIPGEDDVDQLSSDDVAELVAGPALLELHLQDYMHRHWRQIFPDLQLYQGTTGREFRTTEPNVGVLDFLCTDGNGNFVVIETKRGLPDRQAIGQILSYMGWVSKKLCTSGQSCRGVLVVSDGNDGLRMAASAVPNLEIYQYEISFDIRPLDENRP